MWCSLWRKVGGRVPRGGEGPRGGGSEESRGEGKKYKKRGDPSQPTLLGNTHITQEGATIQPWRSALHGTRDGVGPSRASAASSQCSVPLAPRALRFIASDMWKPYLDVIAELASQAVHVLDRFHIVATMNKAVDEVRAGEARELAREGYQPILKHTRWCFLKRPENLTDNQRTKLADVLRYDLRSVRAYLLRESLQAFWNYTNPFAAGWFLDRWCTRALRSRLEPIKKVASTLRRHRELILNWFRAKEEI